MGNARKEKNGIGETGKLATPHPEYPTYDGCEDRTRDAFWAYLKHTLSHDHPNPERIGCPRRETLERQARSKRLDGRISKHIFACSPCYRIYSGFLSERMLEFRAKSGTASRKARKPTSNSGTASRIGGTARRLTS